jgi:hypothetical protein
MEREILNDAAQMEIWHYVWRENYAQTIIQFVDSKLTSDIIIQPKPFESHHHERSEQSSNKSLYSNNLSSSIRVPSPVRYHKCTII